jgi:hypothetical protein
MQMHPAFGPIFERNLVGEPTSIDFPHHPATRLVRLRIAINEAIGVGAARCLPFRTGQEGKKNWVGRGSRGDLFIVSGHEYTVVRFLADVPDPLVFYWMGSLPNRSVAGPFVIQVKEVLI